MHGKPFNDKAHLNHSIKREEKPQHAFPVFLLIGDENKNPAATCFMTAGFLLSVFPLRFAF
ncbi:MAG TPA: hypothetical protein DD400_04590, partial [Rhodospirillaceae bacterium]|nr:hypothetical protein [Rhodospirillaceae bacterium]